MLHFRLPGVARSVALLSLAALAPLLLFAAAGAYVTLATKRSELHANALADARLLSQAIDREIDSQLDRARSLAASPALDRSDLAAFHEVAARERELHPSWLTVILLDTEGRWVLDSKGLTPRREAVDEPSLRQAVSSRGPTIGGIKKGPDGRWGIPVRAPVIRDGKVTYIATVVGRPDAFSELITSLGAPSDWIITIVNQDGYVVARSRREDEFVGKQASAGALKARSEGSNGIYNGFTLEGTPTTSAYWMSSKNGWSVHIGIPRAMFETPLRQTMAILITGLVISLGLAVGLVALLLRDLQARSAQTAAIEQATRMDALGRLTGGVAHDFNNMLMVIQGNADILSRRLGGNAAAERSLMAMRAATERAARLTRQLLVFARGGAIEKSVVELDALVSDLLPDMRQLVGPKVEVELRLDAGPGAISVDALQLEAAILNLCANARDAMSASGRITISTTQEPGWLALSVRDRGPGFPAEVAHRVFDPFFTTKPVGKGTGLGLTQVYGLARASGGAVKAVNAPDGGAVVTLRFPAVETPSPQHHRRPEAVPVGPVVGRVLLVEDDEDVRATTADYLSEAGLEVVEAADASEALARLERENVDAVVSDIVMPGAINGTDLAQAIRKRWPGLPVLLVSGYSATAADAQALGFRVLAKPYALAELDRELKAALASASTPEVQTALKF